MPSLLHSQTFRVRLFECDPTGRATLATLCRFAQEAADGHCQTFGMSLMDVRTQNRMWVITRFQLKIDQYPKLGDAVAVETWASARTNGIRAVREFQFLDATGQTIGNAKSIWLLLDAVSRRPLRLPQVIAEIRNPDRTDPAEFELPRLQTPHNPARSKSFEVGWKELDANHHTNNVNYIEWGLEALPLDLRRDRILTQLDIEYLAEAFHGDQVTSEVELGESENIHQIRNASGKLLSLLVTRHRTALES